MPSKTAIGNRALSKLGETRISNLDTVDIRKAQVLRDMWEHVLKAVLSAYPWNFAVKRIQIAADESVPSWGYDVAYTIPIDFLTLLEIKDNPDYRLEQNPDNTLSILTNAASPLFIRYISYVEDTGIFDPLFSEALAARLALEACESLTQSNTKKQILASEYEKIIAQAYASDSIQDPPQKPLTDDWILDRG